MRLLGIVFVAFLFLTACETANNSSPTDNTGYGLAKTYTFVFRNFTTREVLQITDKMESSPGFVRWRGPGGDSSVSRHGYVTRASGAQLLRDVHDILTGMGLSPDGSVKINIRGTTYNLDKLY